MKKIAYVTEDRRVDGLALKLSVKENMASANLKGLTNGTGIFIDEKKEAEICDKYVKELSIKISSVNQPIGTLSGGNQQKVVISKWLSLDLDVLILDEPTRGVDVKAKAEIYDIMRKLADQGVSIIMISSDLPEILRVSHRVIVMHDGKITLDGQTKDYDQEKIMHAAIS